MATRAYKKKAEPAKTQTIIGVCLGYSVKTASNDSEYADIRLKDDKGIVFNCKLWNWDDNYREYLYPRKYVVVANVKRNLYQGSENFIINDLSVDDEINPKDYDDEIISPEVIFESYRALIEEKVSDEHWKKIILYIVESNEIPLASGVVDTRIGANLNGSLLRGIYKTTRMVTSIADTLVNKDIDYGYLCFSALMMYLSKGLMHRISDDGNVELRDEVNYYGFIGLPLMSMKTIVSDVMPDLPLAHKKLALQAILSTTPSSQVSSYPTIYNNTLEGRIVYHASRIDFVDDTINEYVKGNTESVVAIPELVESMSEKGTKFLIPKRVIEKG